MCARPACARLQSDSAVEDQHLSEHAWCDRPKGANRHRKIFLFSRAGVHTVSQIWPHLEMARFVQQFADENRSAKTLGAQNHRRVLRSQSPYRGQIGQSEEGQC